MVRDFLGFHRAAVEVDNEVGRVVVSVAVVFRVISGVECFDAMASGLESVMDGLDLADYFSTVELNWLDVVLIVYYLLWMGHSLLLGWLNFY